MWYSELYRRHLCDMHIDEWDEEFLSRFSPETYVRNLKKAHINYAMLYLQSHVGLCYFPTKAGAMHAALRGRETLMRDTVDLCHANGIRVCGYYSLNYNTWAHDRNPSWRMVEADGKSRREKGEAAEGADHAAKRNGRYGLCCPNNPDYRQFVFAQIGEMLDFFSCDALFFDMPFWSHTCFCPRCRARWEKECGGQIPENPAPSSAEYIRLLERKYAWMGEWTQAVAAFVKERAPQVAVEFNYASAVDGGADKGCGEEVNAAGDYCGGDLYGGMTEHSFTCKYYQSITRSQPFEYMFSRCKPALRMHTLTKTADEMKTAVALTAAHHGATLVIDAIDPVGTMDERVYARIGEAFALQEPYEPYFRGRMLTDAGILYSLRSRFRAMDAACDSRDSAVGAFDALLRRHIPAGVAGRESDLARYPMLIAPMLTEMDRSETARLTAYAEGGGVLYLSGAGSRELTETLTGGRIIGLTETDKIYLAPTDAAGGVFGWFNKAYPMPFEGRAPILDAPRDVKVLATLTLPYTGPGETRFAAIHSDPPGRPTNVPMILERAFGKGKVIWSAVPIESVRMAEYRDVFTGLLCAARGSDSFRVAGSIPEDVEITLFEDAEGLLVNAVRLCNESVSPAVPAFGLSVQTDSAPKKVLLLPKKTEIPFRYENGRCAFDVPDFRILSMIQILK